MYRNPAALAASKITTSGNLTGRIARPHYRCVSLSREPQGLADRNGPSAMPNRQQSTAPMQSSSEIHELTGERRSPWQRPQRRFQAGNALVNPVSVRIPASRLFRGRSATSCRGRMDHRRSSAHRRVRWRAGSGYRLKGECGFPGSRYPASSAM